MRKKVIEVEKIVKPPVRQARFYGTPGREPIGYRCGDISISRKRNESLEELRNRSRNAVEWPDANTVHIFTPFHK